MGRRLGILSRECHGQVQDFVTQSFGSPRVSGLERGRADLGVWMEPGGGKHC